MVSPRVYGGTHVRNSYLNISWLTHRCQLFTLHTLPNLVGFLAILHTIMPTVEPTNGDTDRRDVPMRPVNHESLSPSDFRELATEHPERVESSKFVPPQLGDSHFGYFEVEYHQPIFRPVVNS